MCETTKCPWKKRPTFGESDGKKVQGIISFYKVMMKDIKPRHQVILSFKPQFKNNFNQ